MSEFDDDFDREPTEAELKEIEESRVFDDPAWQADGDVDFDYPGSDYDFSDDSGYDT